MEAVDSRRKLKEKKVRKENKVDVDSLRKLKEKINRKKRNAEMGKSPLPTDTDENFFKALAKKKNKKRSDDITNKVDAKVLGLSNVKANGTWEANGGNKCKRNSKIKMSKRAKAGKDETDTPNSNAVEGRISVKEDAANEPKDKSQNLRQNKRKNKRKSIERVKRAEAFNETEDAFEQQNDEEIAVSTKLESEDHDTNSVGLNEADTRSFKSSGKSKRSAKQKKKRRLLGTESTHDDLMEKKGNVAVDEVVQMSSGDEDYSQGMKKWVMQYHQCRPGIKVLQERIDDFITAHEAQEEQARMEREAQLEEGGWTVVVHHKGRKKTTDAQSGTAVGSVAQAAVLDKMAKKKSTDIGLDFYRFQRREAHRNEIMMLQSKFEQDKKRIQELRAARKFRPY